MYLNKSLGQNFLKSKSISNEFVNLVDFENINQIIEIGGGGGILTGILAEKIKKFENTRIIVYEIDRKFAINLFKKYEEESNNNVEIKNEDILDANLDEFTENFSVIGAIPYYITSPIIHKLLKIKNRPKQILLIVQLEFAHKLTARIDEFNYWNHITYGYKVSFVKRIDKSEFNPAPKVDSAIVKMDLITDLKNIFTDNNDKNFTFEKWSKFLHHGHKNPRKMLNKAFDKQLLEKVGIDPDLRPQNIDTKAWLELYNTIYN